MPNRMLRDWTNSERMTALSVHAERFFTRLIMKADDYGCFYANGKLLKSSLFPMFDNIREADLLRWVAECDAAGLIVLYEKANKRYLQILDFGQRLDKARPKFPQPDPSDYPADYHFVHERPEIVHDFRGELESEENLKKNKKKENPPGGVSEADASRLLSLNFLEEKEKNEKSLRDAIQDARPAAIEPYRELWNFFAKRKKLPEVRELNMVRKKKFKKRLSEKAFDFIGILDKAEASVFIMKGGWFNFDWVISDDGNYLKVLEGNYDDRNASADENDTKVFVVTEKDVQYLLGRFQEGGLNSKSVRSEHYDYLHQQGLLTISEEISGKALKKRMDQLSGSNQRSDLELLQAYQENNKELTKKDFPVLNKLAKRMAVIDYLGKVSSIYE